VKGLFCLFVVSRLGLVVQLWAFYLENKRVKKGYSIQCESDGKYQRTSAHSLDKQTFLQIKMDIFLCRNNYSKSHRFGSTKLPN